MRRSRHPGARWILLAALLTQAGVLAAVPSSAPRAGYQITGTVQSTRGGVAVPFSQISASPASSTAQVSLPGFAGQAPGPGRLGRGAPAPTMMRGGRPGPPGAPARNQRSAPANPETRADASGRFTLDLPHGGSWRVTAAARGFRSQAYEEHEGYYSSIVLSESVPTYEAKFLLIPDSMISGLVLDEAGEAVPSAQIVAELLPPVLPGEDRASPGAQPRYVANAQADDRGRYELPFLAPGEYRLRAQAQPWYASGARGGPRMGAPVVAIAGGFSGGALPPSPATTNPDPSLDMVYPVTWYPAADSEGGAETVRLADGEQRQADFHLTAIPASHLVVTRPEAAQPEPGGRRPHPQRPVTITRIGSDGSFGQTSFIGGNGREWDFGGLAPGTYEVRLPGPNGDADAETRQIEVRPGGGGVVTLENSKALTRVTLSVDGLPDLESASVEFIDTETGRRILVSPPRGRRGRGGDETDGGEDNLPGPMSVMLPPHRYEVTVMGRSGAYVASIAASGATVIGRTIEIGGGSAAAVALHLANARGELSGVASLGGHPDCGALVLLVPVTLGQPGEPASPLRDQTNSDGSFLFEGVVPGRYILVAIDHGWGVGFRDPATLTRYLSLGVPVEVKGSGKLRKEIAAVAP